MFSAFQTFGRLGAGARAVAAAWSPSALWPTGTEPGMWISPRDLTSQWQDYTGTTPVVTPGTVADSSNPVGLALDIRAGATVLTDPGLHMLQSTSAARPLLSARVNLLTYTESYTANWSLDGVTLSNRVISETAATAPHRIYADVGFVTGATYTFEVELKAGTSIYGHVNSSLNGLTQISINLQTGVIFAGAGAGVSIRAGSNGSWIVTITGSAGAYANVLIGLTNAAGQESYMGNPANNIEVVRAQVNAGEPTDYQSVPGDGSTYTSTGFPIYLDFDGVDDGMATAAFSAGTLINGMDCMIAVRRDSAALNAIGGLYQADQTKYFGVIGNISGDAAPTYGGCGTPTIFVDGVEVANTRGALYDAIGIGEWHILEYRGLDLSAWVDANFGKYGSPYNVNGARGDILLYPSTTPTADKDAARQWLADYYGVTLP